MAEFKYIMFRVTDPIPRDIPVIFPDFLVHDQVFHALRAMEGNQLQTAMPIAAGSMQLLDVECFGKSTTLNVVSRKTLDENIVLSYPYLHGLVSEE